MKVRIAILLISEILCLFLFIELWKLPHTLRTSVSGARYARVPTMENRIAFEIARKEDQRNLMWQRSLMTLALALNTSVLIRTVRRRGRAGMLK